MPSPAAPETTLRLTQSSAAPGMYRVLVEMETPGEARQTAEARFPFDQDDQDAEEVRWYLEDYLQDPREPHPARAARVEARMAAIGTALFGAVFESNRDTTRLWTRVQDRLADTRVEIVTGVREATAIPWELLREPATGTPLALAARSFVRAQPTPAVPPRLMRPGGRLRILLVICRPGGRDDVPFRSVAGRIVKGLGESARAQFDLDVLRPPTFERLSQVLTAARAAGTPYQVVHFDGHGAYLDLPDAPQTAEERAMAAALRALSRTQYMGERGGAHGYLLFENPDLPNNIELVDGTKLGRLLQTTGVPVLVLNACRSAHADGGTSDQPAVTSDQQAVTSDQRAGGSDPLAGTREPGADTQHATRNTQPPVPQSEHEKVRALGSLAQEVMDAGVAGCVAMRYNVYVVTAAQFVADLYGALSGGASLGEAASRGRKQLAADPQRTIGDAPLALQDWPVPMVYEAAPIAFFRRTAGTAPLRITLQAGKTAAAPQQIAAALPPPPDAGFFGRDETLLALDRAFDTQAIVLLWAYAGSGKTSTAAEFARWYSLTGGVDGPVLFTTFERYLPLPRVLDQVGQVFGGLLQKAGVDWAALSDEARRDVALQVFAQVPVLWIWDNVEPVAGFPTGTPSAWSTDEQAALVAFLRDAHATRAKFLLTSRRDERAWLGDNLPARVRVPPMPMQERSLLARALAERHGRRLAGLSAWRPLLEFSGGNPLALTVVVGQALRDGLETPEQIAAYVARLRAGEAPFRDERSEGRTKSLGASLSYGFAAAFDEAERRQLALLHFFQGFVNVGTLQLMGTPAADWCLDSVRGLTREAGITLLDRAAEIGLLTALGGGYYTIHPALPWYFKALFEEYYPEGSGSDTPTDTQHATRNTQHAATRAFVEALGALGTYYHRQYNEGNRDVIGVVGAEEANLRHARDLARAYDWWGAAITTMQGLRMLYHHTGRRAEWARLVAEIVPAFVDPATNGPLPGREEEWGLVTEYRVRLAREARQWAEAERLQRTRVDWERLRAAPALAAPPVALDAAGRNAIRSLAASLHELGGIQRELSKVECATTYAEAIAQLQRIGDQPGEATAAFNLGRAYEDIAALRDLAAAERWYRRSLELHDEGDHLGRSQCLGQLGSVAYARFTEAREAQAPEGELRRLLNAAAQYYEQALPLTPSDAIDSLAVKHSQLGRIYGDAGDLDRALAHYREAIRCTELADNHYKSGQYRLFAAIDLANAGRLTAALEYAQAALRNYATFGEQAADQMAATQGLIVEIETAQRGGGAE